jgi:hypothetical protein
MANRTGGCLCGAVRYELTGDPLATVVCHCTHCQRQSGGMFSTNLVVREAAYAQTGESKVYVDKGDSGKAVWRNFCADCGSPILSKLERSPGLLMIKAGTLDDLSSLAPAMEVYTDHAAGWVVPVAGAKRFSQSAQ